MEIIKIPNKKPELSVKQTGQKAMIIDVPLKFSCDCGNTSILEFDGVIFKYMEFYCSECGTHYKITNPAFQVPPKTK